MTGTFNTLKTFHFFFTSPFKFTKITNPQMAKTSKPKRIVYSMHIYKTSIGHWAKKKTQNQHSWKVNRIEIVEFTQFSHNRPDTNRYLLHHIPHASFFHPLDERVWRLLNRLKTRVCWRRRFSLSLSARRSFI